MRSLPALVRSPWFAVPAVPLVLAVAALCAQNAGLAAALAVLLGLTAWVVWRGELRRPLIAALFFLAPIDVSKALIAAQSQFYSPGLYLSPAHVMTLALLGLFLARRLLWEHRAPPLDRLDLGVLVFVAWLWARSLGSAQGLLAIGSAAAYTLNVMAYYVASRLLRDRADLRLALIASAAALLLEGLDVALQMGTGSLLALPGSKNQFPYVLLSIELGDTGSSFRPIGFQGHPNALADHMVLVLGPALALLLLGPRRLGPRGALLCAAVVGTAAVTLLLTLSRGGWASGLLAVLVGVVAMARSRLITARQLGGFALGALAAALVTVSVYPQLLLRLTEPDSRSVQSRELLNDQALAIIRANPLAGVGFGGYNRASFEYTGPLYATVNEDYQTQLHTLIVHNHYLLIAAELGVPAALGFAALLWRFIRLPRPMRRWRDPGLAALAIGLSASLAGQALYFNSDNYYVDIRMFMFWLLAGLLRATVRIGTAPAAPVAGVEAGAGGGG